MLEFHPIRNLQNKDFNLFQINRCCSAYPQTSLALLSVRNQYELEERQEESKKICPGISFINKRW